MKVWIFPLMLLAACGGKIPVGKNVGLGENRNFSTMALQGDERAQLNTICEALKQKALALNPSINTTFVFSVSQKVCEQTGTGVAADEQVYIQQTGNNYFFKRVADNRDFVFSEIQTPNSGIVGEICSRLNNVSTPLTNPVILTSGKAMWFTTNVNSPECVATSQSLCLMIETGVPSGTNYKITDRDYFKFQVDPTLPRIGFFLQRTNISSGLCGINQTTEIRAGLKNQ